MSIVIPSSVTSISSFAFSFCRKLKTITCYATIPPVAYSRTFYNSTPSQLFVPEESLEAYKSDDVWSKFANISAIPGYDAIESPKASISTANHPTIYNLDGTAVSGDIQSLSPGIYIIVEGGKSRKIIVR
jgi:hypothetical protein